MDASPSILVPASTVDMYDGVKKQQLQAAILRAVEDSFVAHPMRNKTSAEVKRRTELCVMGFRRLRNEHGMSFVRACDTVHQVLAAALDLREHKVSTRSGWMSRR